MMHEPSACRTVSSVRRIQGKAILTLSDGEVIEMPRSMLKERPYRAGMPFDPVQFQAFIAERSYSFALEKAVSLLASRARTEKEIVDALKRNAYPETAIARVMARLHEEGYINDAAFCDQWVLARSAKGMGARRIRQELQYKGVSRQEVDQALASIDEDEMYEAALAVARKASRGKNLADPGDRRKVLAALARRGYEFSIAKNALMQIIDE